MSGRVGDLSPKQEAALKQLRENIKDIDKNYEDAYLLKWLRARGFDIKKSEKMLRDSLEWRKKVGADTILDWTPPEVLTKYYPGGQYGFDKDGYPVWIDALGYADIKGLMYSVRKSDLVKYKIYLTEQVNKTLEEQSKKMATRRVTDHDAPKRMRSAAEMEANRVRSKEWWQNELEKDPDGFRAKHRERVALGKDIDGVGSIFDMDGIGTKHLWRPVVSVFSEILSMFEANYPETLRFCFIINAPRIFPIAYSLVKHFLSEDTKTKIHVLGGGWKETVLQHISPDQLPVYWGGTCTDPDGEPHCRSRINIGGEIPVEYYMERPTDLDMTNFSSVMVNRGSSVQLDYEITEMGSILNWQFWTQDNDIGFGVFRRTSNARQRAGDMVEVVPSERVNSHMVPEHGSITCPTPGTYVVRFDNTYSWVRAKRVSYFIEILGSDEMTGIDIKDSSSFHSCSELQESND